MFFIMNLENNEEGVFTFLHPQFYRKGLNKLRKNYHKILVILIV